VERQPRSRTPGWVAQSLDPLRSSGHLVPTPLEQITPEIEAIALFGHSAGHVGLIVSGPDRQVTLVGDAFNHPDQVTQPELPSIADLDRAAAIRARNLILEPSISGDWPVLASAHLPGGWWTVYPTAGELRWKPLRPDRLPLNSRPRQRPTAGTPSAKKGQA
jgi:glyoxylase-like metal-dependent hydrolase (beta-lactamase superfamily II)